MEEDRYVRITLRIPRELHGRLEDEADRTSKSLNAEIVARLDGSFKAPDFRPEIDRHVGALLARLESLGMRKELLLGRLDSLELRRRLVTYQLERYQAQERPDLDAMEKDMKELDGLVADADRLKADLLDLDAAQKQLVAELQGTKEIMGAAAEQLERHVAEGRRAALGRSSTS